MYLILFACLIVFTFLSIYNDKTGMNNGQISINIGKISVNIEKKDIMYYIAMLVMTVVLCIRYGQGSDYFSYSDLYSMYSSFELATTNPSNHYMEMLYRLVCAFFNTIGFSYSGFVAIVSLFNMLALNRFLKKYSKNPMFSLLLFYPTFYLTYFFSMIRQAIVISVFLGFMIDMLIKKKTVWYWVTCLLLALIHSSAAILIIIPILLKLNLKKIYLILVCAVPVGVAMSIPAVFKLLSYIPFVGAQISNYTTPSVSVLALLERLISFCLVWCLYKIHDRDDDRDYIDSFMKIYTFGLAIYLVFMPFPLISSRLMVFFKILEVVLIPCLFNIRIPIHIVIGTVVLGITVVMYFKNIGSYIAQGLYFDSVNVFNYPYFTIFDKEEIWNFRQHKWY